MTKGNYYQGAPLTLPKRKMHHLDPSFLSENDKGWNSCLDEIAKLGALYMRPVPADPTGVGIDERAEFEKAGFRMGVEARFLTGREWRIWQARATLSASAKHSFENKGIKTHDGRCKAAEEKLLVQHILDNDKGLSDSSRVILEKLIEE